MAVGWEELLSCDSVALSELWEELPIIVNLLCLTDCHV